MATHPIIKGVVIRPDKTLRESWLGGLEDYQNAVDGMIEPVNLSFGTMYVNEEFSYRFTSDDVNWIASDVASLGGRPEFMLRFPILGPVVVVGPLDDDGYDTEINEAGRRAIRRVSREAGGKWEAA